MLGAVPNVIKVPVNGYYNVSKTFYFNEEEVVMMKKLLVVLLLACVANVASATVFRWVGTGETDLWNNTIEWTYPDGDWTQRGLCPGPDDRTRLSDPGTSVRVTAGNGAAVVQDVLMGVWHAGAMPTLTVESGSFQALDPVHAISIAFNPGCAATMNVSGGSVRSESQLYVGTRANGVLNVTDGLVDINYGLQINAEDHGQISTVDISGGLVKAAQVLSFSDDSKSHINLSGDGELAVSLAYSGQLQDLIDRGILAGVGGPIGFSETMNPGYNTAYIVPEPVSLALLGLGSLFVARRRK